MSRCPYCGLKYCERIDHKNQRIAELEAMMSSYPSEEGIVEYFEGLVEYMRKLGYEDPRDKRIAELEAEALNNRLACESMQARLDAAKNCPTHEATGCDSRGETFAVVYLLKDDVLKALGGDDVN